MKYLCLVYLDERIRSALPKAEADAWIGQELRNGEDLRKNGYFRAAQSLQSVQTATTLRIRNGKLNLTDGPFAETREQLAECILIEARDLNEAIQAAAKIPGAGYGSVEVRPVRESQTLGPGPERT